MAVGEIKRFKCTVSYIGRTYSGWQSQKRGDSVQEALEAAVSSVTGTYTKITGSGRTDAGVSARGQVFHFDTDKDLTAARWYGALNSHLPDDIRIMETEEVDDLFHARYNVRKKQYDYRIHTGQYDVFSREYAYQCPYALDIEKMKEASRYLIGTHDFTSFNSNPLSEMPDQVRTVSGIVFHEEENGILRISFTGKGFLRYMVRMMCGSLLEAGRGRIEPLRVKEILEMRSKDISTRNAPACGLTLTWVDYYDVAAKDSLFIIREFLEADEIPEGHELKDLEEGVKERKDGRIYAVWDRQDHSVKGFCSLSQGGVSVHSYDDALYEQIRSLADDIREPLHNDIFTGKR
ncbi:MAG: tRNA pseudouridine(38-40) synthase TruA [Solobacterium sp.]|nr:tRNA pseudouridine(38-40) synthase TruA [Solobacterium sp.]